VVVTPRAGRNEVAGWRGDELHVRVTAAPADGKANDAVCVAVAHSLGVPKSAVRVVSGGASRHKTLEAEGVSADDVREAFGQP
jgi:hypothetical protein